MALALTALASNLQSSATSNSTLPQVSNRARHHGPHYSFFEYDSNGTSYRKQEET
jgi:uncharacterized protein YcfL